MTSPVLSVSVSVLPFPLAAYFSGVLFLCPTPSNEYCFTFNHPSCSLWFDWVNWSSMDSNPCNKFPSIKGYVLEVWFDFWILILQFHTHTHTKIFLVWWFTWMSIHFPLPVTKYQMLGSFIKHIFSSQIQRLEHMTSIHICIILVSS